MGEIDRLSAYNNLLRWKAEIDERRILLNLPFPEDYDNSPKYAVQSLLDAMGTTKGGEMRFSLDPDEHMRWIYDYRHPEYNSARAKDLRERRAHALASCPAWMLDQAAIDDDARREQAKKDARR